ncbi:MAG TPA: HAMP domain-containing sensor histidine kinase [Bacteroidales bacterium]|nr:HAMP domain-containing sensor histidine kinase [Bacteroidales bacterium]
MSKLSDEELLEELRKRIISNKESLQELQDLNKELQIVNKKLEESESLKSHFISNITNEIINPFTSIIGLARHILSVKKEDWKTVISMVALIHSEAFTLDFQLRNIFVAAKIEAGEIYPEILNVDIKTLVNNLLEAFRLEAKKKKLNLELEIHKDLIKEGETFYFKTDPEKLKLVLSNLLSNAIKFSFEGQRIILKIWKVKDSLHISVQDFGTGINEENQKKIFDRFKRLDTGINSLNRGHGLGLSINKAILDLFNGNIDIQSKLGEGSIFTINIPESLSDVAGFSTDGNEFLFEEEEMF